MTHTESSVKVYFTKNYSLFTNIKSNRKLNNSKVNSIVNDIFNGIDLLRYCPILVTEKGNKLPIHDGQHRFAAAVKARSAIWYILCEDFTVLQIAKANANTEQWKTKDYFNLYILEGNENYKTLHDYMQKTKLPFSCALLLLSEGTLGTNNGLRQNKNSIFKKGKFEVNYKDKANAFWELVECFKKFPGHNSRSFIIAIDIVVSEGKMNFTELVDKFNNNNPEKFKKAGSVEEYLTMLTQLYKS